MILQVQAGQWDKARALHLKYHRLFTDLFIDTNPIPVKAALNLLGHEVGGLRLPLVPATEDETTTVGAELRRLGLLT